MARQQLLGRRNVLALLAALPETPLPDTTGPATMIVAGPDGGRVDRIALQLAPLLARRVAPGRIIRRRGAGGVDGVTGANQFTARASPDGETVLLVPGAAALAWLMGDMRAHFDTAAWVPVMAGMSSGVVAARLSAEALMGDIVTGAPLRIAAELTGYNLPALLALELLGATLIPVRGLRTDAAMHDALQRGAIDLVFLRERQVRERLASFQSTGAVPLFSLGAMTETGALTRDPLLPDLPDFVECYRTYRAAPPQGPLFTAWRAAAAASQLDFALVLPQLTPAASVAIWRQAANAAADTSGWYPRGTFRVLPPAMATAYITATAADPPAQLELRRWMATRFDWRAG
jgi:hypothetical protein